MALLPDQKFSTFQNGGNLQVGDIIVGLRGGINTRFTWIVPPGVTSLTGTLDEVLVNGSVGSPVIGDITLTLPQAIGFTSTPTFAGLTLTSPLTVANGGTGDNSFTAYALIAGGTTSTGSLQQVSGLGTSGQVLVSNGAAALPTWQSVPGLVPAALTKVDDTNVTLTLGGTPATALLQATSITAGWTGTLALNRGGLDANLTASLGGIFYSTASAGAILAGTATANLPLLSGSSAAPTWGAFALSLGGALTTAEALTTVGAFGATFNFTNTTNVTFPTSGTLATTASASGIVNSGLINQLAWYAASGTTISGLATANNGVLVTSAGGVPSISTTLPSGISATNMVLTTPLINQINDTNGNEILALSATASAVNFFSISNAIASGTPVISTSGTDPNVFMNFQTKGTAGYRWFDGSSNEVFSLTAVASAVNYLDIKNSATSVGPSITAFGTDPNIAVNFNTKGSGNFNFFANSALVTNFVGNASAVNYISITNAATGNTPVINSAGSDPNVPLKISSQGDAGVIIYGASGDISPVAFVNGTAYQHETIFQFANTANTRTVVFPDANFTVADNSGIILWTPVFSFDTPGNLSVSYATQSGTYIKIGNAYICNFNITCTPTYTTAAGELRITGLPTTSSSSNLTIGSLFLSGTFTFPASITHICCFVNASVSFVKVTGSGTPNAKTNFTINQFTSGSPVTLVGSVIFFA